MEPPMSDGSMHHREPESEIDDPGHFLQGASCPIAAHTRTNVWLQPYLAYYKH
jgi:hypothetical protein